MDPFLSFVENEAKHLGKVFVLDCGEGRETHFKGMEVEDLSGWLLSETQAEQIPHETRAERDALFERDDVEAVIAKWKIVDGKLQTNFKSLD